MCVFVDNQWANQPLATQSSTLVINKKRLPYSKYLLQTSNATNLFFLSSILFWQILLWMFLQSLSAKNITWRLITNRVCNLARQFYLSVILRASLEVDDDLECPMLPVWERLPLAEGVSSGISPRPCKYLEINKRLSSTVLWCWKLFNIKPKGWSNCNSK